MMITSEFFETASASFRSRFISPVYTLANGQSNFCINLKYNIYGSNTDGFRLILENYLNGNEFEILFVVRGPLPINKWYSEYIQAKNIFYDQFRVNFYIKLRIKNTIIFNFLL